MNNYNKLKEVIQKANPEIMEHKVSCLAIDENKNKWKFVGVRFGGWWKIGSENDFTNNPKNFKILGRPIRLTDVLLALNNDRNNMFNVLIMPDGNFGCFGLGRFRDRQFGWNLKNDNLDNQSDEVKEFLIKLLVE